jgi:hypothetical protein
MSKQMFHRPLIAIALKWKYVMYYIFINADCTNIIT